MIGSAPYFALLLGCVMLFGLLGALTLVLAWSGCSIAARRSGWIAFYLSTFLALWSLFSIDLGPTGGRGLLGGAIWGIVSWFLLNFLRRLPPE